jgi:hypothetical protein
MKMDHRLRELVFEIFRETEGISIAGLVRELESRGVRSHRLIVTGYLQALVDVGYLDVRAVPPSKLFTLKSSHRATLFSVVGEVSRGIHESEARASELAVASLQRLLDRPVFLSEIAQMGFSRTGNLHQLNKKERAIATKRMEDGGVPIKEGEPMFQARNRREEEVDQLLEEVVLESYRVRGERPKATVQTALTLERFA